MKKAVSLLLALLLLLVLSACQATPEEAIVVAKDQEKFLEQAQASADALETELAEAKELPRIQMEFSGENLSVTVDAEAEIPEGNVPIVQVESVDFTQEWVDTFWNALVGDAPMYGLPDMTKEEISEYLAELRNALINTTGEEERKIIEADIAEKEKLYETASETYEPVRVDSTLKEVAITNYRGETVSSVYTGVSAKEDPLNNSKKCFEVTNNYVKDGAPEYRNALMEYSTSYSTYQYYENYENEVLLTDETTIPEQALNLKIAPEIARETVEQLIADTNAPFGVGTIKLVKNELGLYAYLIECYRVINGIPCAIVTGETETAEEYSKRWVYENFKVVVGNDGIIGLRWNAPLNVGEEVLENTAKLSSEEILKIFEKMMPMMYQPLQEETGTHTVKFEIDQVKLELVRVLRENANEEGMLIPVWSFYGAKTDSWNESEYTERDCWLMVNAVDGSIVDRTKGY